MRRCLFDAHSPNAMRNLTPADTNFIKSRFGTYARKSLHCRKHNALANLLGASENCVLLSLEHFVSLGSGFDFKDLKKWLAHFKFDFTLNILMQIFLLIILSLLHIFFDTNNNNLVIKNINKINFQTTFLKICKLIKVLNLTMDGKFELIKIRVYQMQ